MMKLEKFNDSEHRNLMTLRQRWRDSDADESWKIIMMKLKKFNDSKYRDLMTLRQRWKDSDVERNWEI